jgi:hypothetical protein
MRSAADRIFSFVQQFCPVSKRRQQSFTELYEKVVMPSFDLALDMQTSWSQYIFTPDMKSLKQLYEFQEVKMDKLTTITARDFDTRIPLEGDEPIVCDCDGFIGRPVLLVEPALGMIRYLRHEDGGLNLSLRRGTYLIKLFHQLEQPGQSEDEQSLQIIPPRSDEEIWEAVMKTFKLQYPLFGQNIHKLM